MKQLKQRLSFRRSFMSTGARASLLRIGVTVVAICALSLVAGEARAGAPWDGDGHCQFGSVYSPPPGGIYMSDGGRSLRQCNSTSTADHGSADVGSAPPGFAVFRTTGGSQEICSGGKCGFRWYLRDRGWIHCAWTTAVC
jgi:hypothetical protein